MGLIYLPYSHKSLELRFALLTLLLLLSSVGSAQLLKTAWDKDYGGNIWEDCNSVIETNDGGYLMGGYTSSTVTPGGDVSDPPLDGFFPPPDVGDYWIIKTDANGIRQWDQRYGGNKQDRLWAAQQTTDGGYILGGASNSDAGPQKTGANRGDEDYWIIKTDAQGVAQWDSTYGGDSTDYFYSLIQTSDGGYLLGGISRSDIGAEKTENHRGDFDMWFIKLDANGAVVWDKTIGGNGEERLNEMQESADGHFWIAGSTASDADGMDVLESGFGGKDYWFIKLEPLAGNKVEEFRYGGLEEDEIQSFEQTLDGGFLLGGGSRSGISAMKQEASQWVDFWIIKIDALGTIEWEETFGGPELENCYSVKQNNIGNYLIGGYSASGIGPDKTEANRGPIGTEDFWLLYLAPDGTKLWDKTLGGSSRDVLENLFQTSDGGYMLAGHSSSPISGDKTTDNRGLNDFWIIKTLCNVSVEFTDTIVCPNTEVMLNASDTNCVQCTWLWEDGAADSIRMLTVSQTSSYSVTLVDGVGCSWTDDINIDLHTPPTLNLGVNLELCEGDSTSLAAGINGVQYEWSTGETSAAITIDSTDTYRLIVTDANSCTAADSIDLFVHPLPEVNLGNDTSLCAGESILLNAGNPGASYVWWPGGIFQTLSAIPPGPGTYSVTVTDANTCSAVDSLSILEVFSVPQAMNVIPECNDLNTTYTVTFMIENGDALSYSVSGNSGTLTGNTFVSDPINRGENFSFSIDDDNACGPSLISGSYDCACTSDAGTLVPNPVTVCGVEIIPIGHTGESLDQNDVVQFIIHDGDATNIGTILLTQDSPIFQFQTPLLYGITYYVVALVGNEENGGVNLSDGCLSVSNAVPIVFYESPVPVIVTEMGTQITCGIPNLPLSAATSQPLGQLDFDWTVLGTGNITTATDLPIVEVNEAGTYQVVITDVMSGCTALTSLVVEADEGVPNILVAEPDIYTCKDTLITLDASGSSFGAPFILTWHGGNIEGLSGLNPVVTEPGEYSLEILNSDNDCKVNTVIQVLADTLAPMVDAGETAILDCVNELVNLSGTISVDCTTCIFEWSSRDGNFVAGINSLSPLVDVAAAYTLSVYDDQNGCSATDEVWVIEDPDIPTSALINIQAPPCLGEENGSVFVEAVKGGDGPYTYSLDGENFSNSGDFSDLAPGNYQLFIQDAKGCEWDTLINLPQALPLQVDLGEDQTIDLGESLTLNAWVNRPIANLSWTNPELIDCGDCKNPVILPIKETTIQVSVVDAAGCEATDAISILVRKKRTIYIPSAFSSDFNGVNDYFTIYADQSVKNINFLRIYSRWGELLFERENFLPNQELMGWDGTMRGKDLDVGIYVYVAELEFVDGFVEVYRGDVLLSK